MEKGTEEKMMKIFRTAFHVAFYEKPFTEFPWLLELQECNGLLVGDTYKNDKQCKLFLEHIAGIYHADLKKSLISSDFCSDFFSVLCDSSTDRSETEKEIVYIRVMSDGYPTFLYLKMVDLESGKSHGIVQTLDNAFQDFGFIPNEWQSKLVGFGSDGAAVMMGVKSGVATLLKNDVPWLVEIHCLAHRLELAIKECLKGTYMDNIVDILTSVYYFYKGSASKRTRGNI